MALPTKTASPNQANASLDHRCWTKNSRSIPRRGARVARVQLGGVMLLVYSRALSLQLDDRRSALGSTARPTDNHLSSPLLSSLGGWQCNSRKRVSLRYRSDLSCCAASSCDRRHAHSRLSLRVWADRTPQKTNPGTMLEEFRKNIKKGVGRFRRGPAPK